MQKVLHSILLLLFTTICFSQVVDSAYIQLHYDKASYSIEMRDGVHLYTIVYTPKPDGIDYPFIMNRTCYNASRNDNYKISYQPSEVMIKEKYILVFQDVRGRYMSEGQFDNMRPNVPGNDLTNKQEVDESSDTYDTIDWLIKNIKNNNGKVGMLGVSYPGFYTAAALPNAHPSLVASSPQAPISDFFFDDFHHHGAFLMSYALAFPVFGLQKDSLTKEVWYNDQFDPFWKLDTHNAYEFYMEHNILSEWTEGFYKDNFFWQQHVEHPNYDEFWQSRGILPHLKDIGHAVLTVGGWFDAEDLYGPLNIYKTIEKTSPKANNKIIMGPWKHGDWARDIVSQEVNHISFGDSLSSDYQLNVEAPFFKAHLKGNGEDDLPEAKMYDTGKKIWNEYDQWPPKTETVTLSFGDKEVLYVNEDRNTETSFSYLSDPDHPVPYRSEVVRTKFTPKLFMTDDQRQASTRPDVLTFETDTLLEDMTLAGEILADLVVSMTETDADFIVKLIDVYPGNHPQYDHNPDNIIMAGYQQLVRSEVFRGRFRNDYAKPAPFVPNEETKVSFPLQDILHTFKKGHKIMIQIHSTWFPYIDRNPQKYVDNIFKAKEEDYIPSMITIHPSSRILIGGDVIK